MLSEKIFSDFSGIIRDYDALNNKPTIDGKEVVGEIGENYEYLDEEPTENSKKLMTSGDLKEHFDSYYTKSETEEKLSLKSDVGHIHNDMYYTESETEEKLSLKSDVGHIHDDMYYTESETEAKLSLKSDVGHIHDDMYYTQSETEEKLSLKSDVGHVHPWYEIVDKPGAHGYEHVASVVLDNLYKGNLDSNWGQDFTVANGVNIGEVLDVTIILSDDSRYTEKCEVLTIDGFNPIISFNNSGCTKENIESGECTKVVTPIDSSKPAFCVEIYENSEEILVYVSCAESYTNATVRILRDTFVKLPNDALHYTDEVTKGSEELVTSGAVYDALSHAGAVESVNAKTGAVVLTAEDVGALPSDTPIPTVPSDVSAFHNDVGYLTEHQSLEGYVKEEDMPSVPEKVSELDNDEGYIKSSQVDASPTQGSNNPVSSGGVYEALAQAGAGVVSSVNAKTGAVVLTAEDVGALPSDTPIPTVPSDVSAFTNDAGYLTEHQSLEEYAKTADLKECVILPVTADFTTKDITEESGKIFQTITEAYNRGVGVFLDVDISGLVAGSRMMIPITILMPDTGACFETDFTMGLITHLTAWILADNTGNFTFTSMAEQSSFEELENELDNKSSIGHTHFQRILTAEDDLNDIFDSGVYVYTTSDKPANAPFNNAAVVEVFGIDSTTTQKIQRAYRYGAPGYSAFRPLYGGSWQSWAVTADSVIETGTTDGWSYRKWFSGKVECWGTRTFTLVNAADLSSPAGVKHASGTTPLPTFVSISDAVINVTPKNWYIMGCNAGFSGSNAYVNFYGKTVDMSSIVKGSTLEAYVYINVN